MDLIINARLSKSIFDRLYHLGRNRDAVYCGGDLSLAITEKEVQGDHARKQPDGAEQEQRSLKNNCTRKRQRARDKHQEEDGYQNGDEERNCRRNDADVKNIWQMS